VVMVVVFSYPQRLCCLISFRGESGSDLIA
jgi:hypothetical protein